MKEILVEGQLKLIKGKMKYITLIKSYRVMSLNLKTIIINLLYQEVK